MKKALVITALSGFIKSFLLDDINILNKMGYEVHTASNSNGEHSIGFDKFTMDNNLIHHEIEFSSTSPFSKETFKAYRQVDYLLKNIQFEVIHVHTPIAAIVVRQVAKKYRKKNTKILYTSHGFPFSLAPKGKERLFYYLERYYSKHTDAILTMNEEDFKLAKSWKCSNVYKINGMGVDIEKIKRA